MIMVFERQSANSEGDKHTSFLCLELTIDVKSFTELRTIMEFKKPLENTLAY
jgi:hypothetical protein